MRVRYPFAHDAQRGPVPTNATDVTDATSDPCLRALFTGAIAPPSFGHSLSGMNASVLYALRFSPAPS